MFPPAAVTVYVAPVVTVTVDETQRAQAVGLLSPTVALSALPVSSPPEVNSFGGLALGSSR